MRAAAAPAVGAAEPAVADRGCTAAQQPSAIGDREGIGSRAPRLLQEIWLLPRNAAIGFMLLYRRLISPLYGQVCRYHPSCSRYALEVFQRQGFVLGVLLTVWRVLRCNPFSPGGIDDPPEREHPGFSISSRGFARPSTRKT